MCRYPQLCSTGSCLVRLALPGQHLWNCPRYISPNLKCDYVFDACHYTAAGLDFVEIDGRMFLSAARPRVCVPVQRIENERVGDRQLYFRCILSWNAQQRSFSSVVIEREIATVTIRGQPAGECLVIVH